MKPLPLRCSGFFNTKFMNKILRREINIISRVIFALMLIVVVTACDSDDEASETKVIATFKRIVDGTTYEADFSYNDSKELEIATSSLGNSIFEFSGGLHVKTSDPFGYYEYEYNDQGRLIKVRSYIDRNGGDDFSIRYADEYTYNSSNQVSRVETFDYNESGVADTRTYYEDFIYIDNTAKNPASSKYYTHDAGQDVTLISDRTYVFDNSISPFYTLGVNQYFVTSDWVPQFSANNLVTAETTTVDGLDDNSISIVNEYDGDGDLIKATFTISRPGNDDRSYSIALTYKTI